MTNWSLLSNRDRRLLNQPIHIFIRAEEMFYPSTHKPLVSQNKACCLSGLEQKHVDLGRHKVRGLGGNLAFFFFLTLLLLSLKP